MKNLLSVPSVLCVLLLLTASPHPTSAGPYEANTFKGRIAWSADGNHNDADDWAASPVALAIFAECGLKNRLVHFDYNCILPLTDPDWEKIHAESVLGAAERYGYNKSLFHDCRRDLDAAVASIAKAVNESSADNPLYFIVAGPMQVPVMGLLKADAAKHKYVYCISHSRWNDGYSKYKYTHTKRDVIATGVNWVQIADQNRLLSLSPYGRPAKDDEWTAFHWMRDSRDPKVQFLWERQKISTRPDPSDAGMAWFLATGDQECDPQKLKQLLEDKKRPTPVSARNQVRLEAENFRQLEGYAVEDLNDRQASHRLHVKSTAAKGSIRTLFAEPYAPTQGPLNVEIRYFDEKGPTTQYAFQVKGAATGSAWTTSGSGDGWKTHTIKNVNLRPGDEIAVTAEGGPGRLDYVQINAPAR